jgi:hypothetical protein
MINLKKMKGEGEIMIFIIIAMFGAWITHVITCLSDERWGFLIAGALVFPIAIIHGIGIWFGAW